MSLFNFIDLFAGIGGMRMAFESIGGHCVFTSEWNKFSAQTYLANFKTNHPVTGDITKVHAVDIPSFDVLLAGFPCQPFSIAGVSKKNALGKNHGFLCETQGTLFFDAARIIEHHKPAAFLLENVKNLKSHDKGRTFQVICQTLVEELGYDLHHAVIDASAFVPQHRERIFLVGFRDKTEFSFNGLDIKKQGPKLESILLPDDKVDGKYTLTDHLWNYLQRYAEKHRAKGNGFGYGLVGPEDVARTLSARYYKDGSEILIKQDGKNPRRLTPRECSRLMGFDSAEREFIIPVSDTQAYRQFGNAVVVSVVSEIALKMLPFILANVG